MKKENYIRIRGLKLHNLRDVDLDIPHNRLVVVTGVSGAGKSSLVFDAVYAESQRRFIETFSPYARQFLERLPRPSARLMENLPAAIAIEQKNPVRNARSTVGTLAELTWPARLLFYYLADLYCPGCGRKVVSHTPRDVVEHVLSRGVSGRETLLLTVSVERERVGEMVEQGWFRSLADGQIIRIDPDTLPGTHQTEFVIDRFRSPGSAPERIRESAEQAFMLGGGRVCVVDSSGQRRSFCSGRHCTFCNIDFTSPTPALFSFNSSAGACPECTGFGRIQAVDPHLVVPDPSLSLNEGAVRPIETRKRWKARLLSACREAGIDVDAPWETLSPSDRALVFSGAGDWPGVEAFFRKLERKRYKPHIRMLIARYRTFLPCPSCMGTRFRSETLWYRLCGLRIPDFYDLAISEAIEWSKQLETEKRLDDACRALLDDLVYRLDTLKRAGLSYLSMSRASRTLSGGEAARINMARALSAKLSNTLYCIDEPSTGLHASDSGKFARLLLRLVDAGNSVLVVDNDPVMISAAHELIELGPGAGRDGGQVVYKGEPRLDEKRPGAVSDYPAIYKGQEKVGIQTHLDTGRAIVLKGVSEHNLQGVDARFPVGAVICISGVSGSGKSTLAEDVLFRAVSRRLGVASEPPGKHSSLEMPPQITFCELVDQSPPSRTPRACVATALKLLDPIRKLFASTHDAQSLGLSAGDFSFNTAGGRCEECAGQGSRVIEMQFLPDVTLPCPACRGRRYGAEVLSVRFNGRNIAQVLEMTLFEAEQFFHDNRVIGKRIAAASMLGLGHLRLGQPLNVLSAGEIQRVKLSSFLLKGGSGRAGLFILDEPTRGLHGSEIGLLMNVLQRLATQGHTVVVVEHDLQVISSSHWVIDLGPGGGDEGGRVVFQGIPSDLVCCSGSITGRVLRDFKHGPDSCIMLREGDGRWTQGCNPNSSDSIILRGAKHHNLKNISVEIPHNKVVVITGVSGSGKSTLAFDCIFSEGQRRYVEGLSSYMRQFVSMYQRPDVDSISGLTPSVAIEQRTSRAGPMSTVATLTETAHFLRLLFAKVSEPWCLRCGVSMTAMSPRDIAMKIISAESNREILIAAPRIVRRKGWHREEFEAGIKWGIRQFYVDSVLYEADSLPELSRYQEHSIFWIIKKITPSLKNTDELQMAVEEASNLGRGTVLMLHQKAGAASSSPFLETFFSTVSACPKCHAGAQEPDPLQFSFSTRAGRCPECMGKGRFEDDMRCVVCKGTRLNEAARSWRIGGIGIDGVFALESSEALSLMRSWLVESPWRCEDDVIARPLVQEVERRLEFMCALGLEYLPLGFAGDWLSGGEAQRIRLAAQAGSGLSGVTIVLDEPTIGLHPVDTKRLVSAFRKLRDSGNSVIVVEHDEETLRSADWIIDMGPGGGGRGGEVVACGTPEQLVLCEHSETARAMRDANRKRLSPGRNVSGSEEMIKLRGVSYRNLDGFDVRFPTGAVTVVTGVSGTGKSTLVSDVIAPAVSEALCGKLNRFERCRSVQGTEELRRIVSVDHSPIGRTPRSCPATYIGVWTEIRSLLACTIQARNMGFGPGRFSFNVEGGRCSACGGQGSVRVSLGYLPDVFVECEQCAGHRFEPATLEVRWKERNVADILAMTMEEARELFRSVPRILRYLSVCCDLGLGYLTLGQPAPTLSGGEAQRLKLAKELASGRCENTLYLLDEPTTGLHMHDVELLTGHLHKFAAMGSTVVIIEHNLDVISCSDWLIDLGPGGGKHGGMLLFCGTPSGFMKGKIDSPTRRALEEYLSVS